MHRKKILVVGFSNGAGTYDLVLARYRAGGLPDPTFGAGDGYVTNDVAGGSDIGYALAVRNGKAVIGCDPTNTFVAARYLLS